MDLKITGGHAFPTSDGQAAHELAAAAIVGITDPFERDRVYTAARAQAQQGMTLRDYFAGHALEGILACQWSLGDLGYSMKDGKSVLQNNAIAAYEIADAMLEARGAA